MTLAAIGSRRVKRCRIYRDTQSMVKDAMENSLFLLLSFVYIEIFLSTLFFPTVRE